MQCVCFWVSKDYFAILYTQFSPKAESGHGVGNIAYGEHGLYPHVQGSENNTRCDRLVRIYNSDTKRVFCLPFPIWMLKKLQWHVTLSTGSSCAEVRPGCKHWRFSGKEDTLFGTAGAMLGQAAPRAWECWKVTPVLYMTVYGLFLPHLYILRKNLQTVQVQTETCYPLNIL